MKTVSSVPYTADQVAMIAEEQITKQSLATRLAYESGIKASEIASLRPPRCRTVDVATAHDDHLFAGRENQIVYTVENTQGLSRRITVSRALSKSLEEARLPCPIQVEESGWSHLCVYEIGAGHAWVHSFSEASDVALGFSHGTQGLRHAYILERFFELMVAGFTREERIEIIGIETGLKPGSVERYIMADRSTAHRHVA